MAQVNLSYVRVSLPVCVRVEHKTELCGNDGNKCSLRLATSVQITVLVRQEDYGRKGCAIKISIK